MALDNDGRWIAGIGDPSVVGWVTVAVYAVGVTLAARNAAAAQRSGVPTSFWFVLTAVLLALGINKQLDLQSWFGQTGRDMAIAQGWYESRRAVQAVFIALLGATAVALLVWARRQWAGLWHEYRWVFGGITLLLVFIVIRAASFHHIDEFIGIDVGVTTFGRALELTGVLLIGAACAHWHAMHRRRVRAFAVRRGYGGR
jgi:hypothetical protein